MHLLDEPTFQKPSKSPSEAISKHTTGQEEVKDGFAEIRNSWAELSEAAKSKLRVLARESEVSRRKTELQANAKERRALRRAWRAERGLPDLEETSDEDGDQKHKMWMEMQDLSGYSGNLPDSDDEAFLVRKEQSQSAQGQAQVRGEDEVNEKQNATEHVAAQSIGVVGVSPFLPGDVGARAGLNGEYSCAEQTVRRVSASIASPGIANGAGTGEGANVMTQTPTQRSLEQASKPNAPRMNPNVKRNPFVSHRN